jgi:hypothetical protein
LVQTIPRKYLGRCLSARRAWLLPSFSLRKSLPGSLRSCCPWPQPSYRCQITHGRRPFGPYPCVSVDLLCPKSTIFPPCSSVFPDTKMQALLIWTPIHGYKLLTRSLTCQQQRRSNAGRSLCVHSRYASKESAALTLL